MLFFGLYLLIGVCLVGYFLWSIGGIVTIGDIIPFLFFAIIWPLVLIFEIIDIIHESEFLDKVIVDFRKNKK